ncbi:hypothetical protein RHL97_19095 [Clostridioides difficile]|nr:hypothetical protein [Clostridioides difficile]
MIESTVNYDSIDRIINKLNMKSVDKTHLLGIFCDIIYSKEIFKRNRDVAKFLQSTIKLDLPDYVVRSRTLLTARTIKFIYLLSDESELEEVRHTATKLLKELMEDDVKNKPIKESSKKKRNENDKLKAWLKGL